MRYLYLTNNNNYEDDKDLYLGYWCLNNSIYNHNLIKVSEAFGLESRQRDSQEVYNMSLKLLRSIYGLLNEIHNVNYDFKFWSLFLGNWLFRYCSTLYYRYSKLSLCISKHNIDFVVIRNIKDYKLVTKNTTDYYNACDDDMWNNMLWGKIIECSDLDIKIKYENEEGIPYFNKTVINSELEFKDLIHPLIFRFYRNSKYYINHTYLPKLYETLISVCLFELPKITMNETLPNRQNNVIHRNDLKQALIRNDSSIYSNLLFDLMPSIFLEDFDKLRRYHRKYLESISPKHIIISGRYDAEDLFKFWIAKCRSNGTVFTVGQHGGHFGVSRILIDTINNNCDNFITWGWSNNKNEVAGFCFKTANQKTYKYNKRKTGIIFIDTTIWNPIYTWDTYAEAKETLITQTRFMGLLDSNIVEQLKIKLFPDKLSVQKTIYWNKFNSRIKLIHMKINLNKEKLKSRLIIENDNNTSFLENISLNIPCILLPNRQLNDLNSQASDIYEALYEANIIFKDHIKAAEFVNNNYDSIYDWWKSDTVQQAIIPFQNNYSRHCNTPLTSFYKIIKAI